MRVSDEKGKAMSELIKVPFHEGEILAVKDERGEWVVIRPLCEQLGIDMQAQRRRIQRAPWGGDEGLAMMATPSAGGEQQSVCLHRKRVAMWLATIEVSRVKEEVRPYLAKLQKEAADVLDAYFTGKGAAQQQAQRPGSVDGLLESTRLLLASVEAMAAQEKRLAVVEQHIERIEAQRAVATSEMFATERADEKPAEVTPRMKVVRLHRAFCTATGADFRDTWNWLYREFRDRYHFDAKVRAENRKCSTLDVIEQEGLMGALYVLASDLFVARGVA